MYLSRVCGVGEEFVNVKTEKDSEFQRSREPLEGRTGVLPWRSRETV